MQSWKKISENYGFKGFRSIIQKKFELPNGKQMVFDIVEGHSFVSVAAITKEQNILLVRQYRGGPEKFLTSFPEGYIDAGEDPIESARRELLEETGYQAEKIVFLKEIHAAYSHSRKLCFVATGCKKVAEQRLDDSEFIDLQKMPLIEFIQYMKNPQDTEFTSIDTAYLAFDYLNILK